MPVIVNCPSCSGPLRVADELLGRKVRCPSCQTIFEAAVPPPSADDRREPEDALERIDTWKQLDLEMARDREPDPPPLSRPAPPPREEIPAPPPRPSPPPPRMDVPPLPRTPGLVGAVEIDPGPQEPPRRPSPPPERSEPKKDSDDLRPCPACRRMIHKDSTRCYNCGDRVGDVSRSRHADDRRDNRREYDRDVRRPRYDDFDRQPRRDTEPHRGTIILVLGIISLVCLPTACLMVTNLIGVVLGVIGWWMGQVDLAKMKAGSMDPEGHGMTQGGWICSILGTVLNLLIVLSCGAWMIFVALEDMDRQQQMQQNNPAFQQPPPVQRKMINNQGAPPPVPQMPPPPKGPQPPQPPR